MHSQVSQALDALAVRCEALDGPSDPIFYIAAPTDYPALNADPEGRHWLGYLQGAADALGVTIIGLLDEYDFPAP